MRLSIPQTHSGNSSTYAIRLSANDNLLRDIEELLTRPVGRPSRKPVVWYKRLSVSGCKLEDGTPDGGEGGVSCWRVVPAEWDLS
jgi:hypothetical protein